MRSREIQRIAEKTVLVSLATNSYWYPKGMERLQASVRIHAPEVATAFYMGEDSVGAPRQDDASHAFKKFAIARAMRQNPDAQHFVWIDVSMWLVRDLEPLYRRLLTPGWFAASSGTDIGTWTMDHCFDEMNVKRDDYAARTMLASGFFALSLGVPECEAVLADLFATSNRAFHGPKWGDPNAAVKGHRHDQSVLSILWHKHGLSVEQEHPLWVYDCDYPEDKPVGSQVVARCRGMGS